MPDTGPEAARLAGLPWDENRFRTDPAYNKALGRAYFGEQLRVNDGDLPKAYAAYNAGPGALKAALRAGGDNGWLLRLPQETQAYVAKNMQAYAGATPSGTGGAGGGAGGGARPAYIDPNAETGIPLLDKLPPNHRAEWIAKAQASMHQGVSQARAELTTRVRDAEAMWTANGTSTDDPRKDEFIQAWGLGEGSRQYQAYEDTKAYGLARQQTKTMSNADLVAMKETAKPAPGEGFAVRERNYKSLVKAIDENIAARQHDPIDAALQKPAYGLRPIKNFGDPQALAAELQKRGAAMGQISRDYGTHPAILTKGEADTLGQMLADAPPAAQGQLLGAMSGALPDPRAYTSAIGQATKAKGDAVLAFAGIARGRQLVTTQGRALSDLLLEGRAILKDGSFPLPPKEGAGGMLAQFNTAVGGAIEPGTEDRNAMFDASRALYAKLAKDAGGKGDAKTLDVKLYGQAVKLATGGLVEHAGYKTIPPYGMPADVFENKIVAAKREAEKTNGQPAMGYAPLYVRAVGGDRYELLNGMQRQTDPKGNPVVLTIR
jgi:hypothetical protein